jgi:hypothetical protein
MDQEQLNQTENNMQPKKKKSQKDAKKAIANMGANLGVMMSGASPQTDSQSVNAEGTEIGSVETTLSSVPDNPPVTNHVQDAKVQSAESAECNDIPETKTPSEPVGGSEMDPPTPVEVNIDIEKTQGNAIYSSLLGLQNTLDNFELDVNKDSLRLVVHNAIKEAISEHLVEQDKDSWRKKRNFVPKVSLALFWKPISRQQKSMLKPLTSSTIIPMPSNVSTKLLQMLCVNFLAESTSVRMRSQSSRMTMVMFC